MPEKTQTVPRRMLTPNERESLRSEIDQKKSMLKADHEFGEGDYRPAIPREVTLNKEKLQGDVARLQRVLDEDSPQRVTGPERVKLEADMKELERQFSPYLETWEDLGVIRMDTPEYKRAMEKNKGRAKVEHLILRWKELAKRLEPDDPSFSSLNRIRKDR